MRARAAARGGVGVEIAGAGTGAGVTPATPSVTDLCVVVIEAASLMKPSRTVEERVSEGVTGAGRGVGVPMGPSSAAAGAERPMAQSATPSEAWRTRALFFMGVNTGRDGSAEVATGAG